MAIEFVGSTTGTGTGATYAVSLTSLTGGVGSAPIEGDVVVVTTGWASTANGDPGVTTSGYAELVDLYANDTRDANMAVAWKRMGSTPDTSVTVSGSNSTASGGATVVMVWRGVNVTTPIDVTSTTATALNGSRANSPLITPITDGAVILACGLGTGDSTPTVAVTGPSNMTGFVQVAGTGSTQSARAGMAYFTGWTSGSFTPNAWTGGESTTSDSWAAATVVLRQEPPPPIDGEVNLEGTSSLSADLTQFIPPTFTGFPFRVSEDGNYRVTEDGNYRVRETADIILVSGDASLTGTSALSSAGLLTLNGLVGLSGSGLVSVNGSFIFGAEASLSGSGAISASGMVVLDSLVALSGSSTVSAIALLTLNAGASLAGSGDVTADGNLTLNAASGLAGSGTVSALGGVTLGGLAALSGTSSVASTGTATFAGATSLQGNSTVSASAVLTLGGLASLLASGVLTAQGKIIGTIFVKKSDGTWVKIKPYVYTGGQWKQCDAFVNNGTEWNQVYAN